MEKEIILKQIRREIEGLDVRALRFVLDVIRKLKPEH